ncbi:MAG: sulfite exporter TauE/SafE family protein [Acetobacteraceae bacterium]
MTDTLGSLLAWCGTVPLGGSLGLGLFLAGAAGGAMHCAPMCGGFVLGQVADRLARTPAARLCEWRRVSAAMLLPYHLGRLTTYAGLGAAAGFGGAMLARIPYVSAALLLAGAVLFLLIATRHALPLFTAFNAAPAWLIRLTGAARTSPSQPAALKTYLTGICLGFLPCGLLYAALAVAASAGTAVMGAMAMIGFGLGTVPALLVVGIAGTVAGHRWRKGMAAIAPTAMILNAVLLAVLAVRTLLPLT